MSRTRRQARPRHHWLDRQNNVPLPVFVRDLSPAEATNFCGSDPVARMARCQRACTGSNPVTRSIFVPDAEW